MGGEGGAGGRAEDTRRTRTFVRETAFRGQGGGDQRGEEA